MRDWVRRKSLVFGLGVCACVASVALARGPAGTSSNAAFKIRLAKPDTVRHALNRLTFGPRASDFDTVSRMGLKRWVERQLHPEQIPENPVLLERLQPLESLRLSIREAYLRYPPPQLIAAVARGQKDFPDDPELRALLTRLVERYVQRKGLDPVPQNPRDSSDLDGRAQLQDILTPVQIQTLWRGKPEEKKQLLEAL